MIDAKEQVLKICEILYDKKALNIRALNVADKTIIAEWFVVCSGRATTQVRTLCDELEDKAADMGLTVLRKEGYGEARWIVLDFGHILVHIFHRRRGSSTIWSVFGTTDPSKCINFSKEKGED